MSGLGAFRDHCRMMAAAKHKPECVGEKPGIFHPISVHPSPTCGGCNPTRDRALFERLAAEIDDYLAPQPDLFGDLTDEPAPTTRPHDAEETAK